MNSLCVCASEILFARKLFCLFFHVVYNVWKMLLTLVELIELKQCNQNARADDLICLKAPNFESIVGKFKRNFLRAGTL